MEELDGLTKEQLEQYQAELLAKRKEMLDAMADERRLKPTLEIGADGVPIQKGTSGEEMMSNVENKEGYTLDGINQMLGDVERRLQASAKSFSFPWAKKTGSKGMKWYD